MPERKHRLVAALIAAGSVATLLASIPNANATLQLQSGLVGGSGDVDNVIFNACGTAGGPALTVQGCLNTNHSTLVNFTGNENLVISGGGQAVVNAEDGAFDNVTIQLADATLGFSKLQFNLDAIADGTANFEAVDQFGNTFHYDNIALDGNGQNFFTLFSEDNQVAVSFRLTSTVQIQNITDLEQVRLGPTEIQPPIQAPEPASLAMLGGALIGFGVLRRRKRA
jgi:hypothetical protein